MTVTLKQIEFYEAVCQAGNVTAAELRAKMIEKGPKSEMVWS